MQMTMTSSCVNWKYLISEGQNQELVKINKAKMNIMWSCWRLFMWMNNRQKELTHEKQLHPFSYSTRRKNLNCSQNPEVLHAMCVHRHIKIPGYDGLSSQSQPQHTRPNREAAQSHHAVTPLTSTAWKSASRIEISLVSWSSCCQHNTVRETHIYTMQSMTHTHTTQSLRHTTYTHKTVYETRIRTKLSVRHRVHETHIQHTQQSVRHTHYI